MKKFITIVQWAILSIMWAAFAFYFVIAIAAS